MKDNNIIMFGVKVSASCGIIPKYRRDEKDETTVSVHTSKTGMSTTRKGGRKERQKMDDLHGRNADTMHHAHERHIEKIAYGRGKAWGTETDDVRFRRQNEIMNSNVNDNHHQLWWSLFIGRRYYSAKETRFFGTREEADSRLKEMLSHRPGQVGFILLASPEEAPEKEFPWVDFAWENGSIHIDYSEEEIRNDFGKTLSRSIGYEFGFGQIITVEKR